MTIARSRSNNLILIRMIIIWQVIKIFDMESNHFWIYACDHSTTLNWFSSNSPKWMSEEESTQIASVNRSNESQIWLCILDFQFSVTRVSKILNFSSQICWSLMIWFCSCSFAFQSHQMNNFYNLTIEQVVNWCENYI